LSFLRKVLPAGLDFHSTYYRAGERYITTLLVNSYPSYLPDLLFAKIFNEEGKTVTFDVTYKPKHEAVEDLEKSINELSSRYVVNRNSSEDINDGYDLNDLRTLHADLQRTRENIAYTTLRFIVTADSPEELSKRVQKLKDELSTYSIKVNIPENEMQQEYRSLQNSANSVRQPIPVIGTLERQFPFYFQAHEDPRGLLSGETPTGGLVLLDIWKIDNERKSYDIVIIGKKGAGKSADIKSGIQIHLSMGNKIMAFDVDGELSSFTKKLGGRTIRPSDESGRVNVLEFRQMFSSKYDNEKDKPTDEKSIIRANYTSELSRVMCFFYQMIPDLSDAQADMLSDLLQITYRKRGITENTKLDGLPADAFPVMTDLLATVRDALYISFDADNEPKYRPSLSALKRDILESLEIAIKPMAEGIYASIFNGASTVDISKEDFVVFDMSLLGEMEDKVFNAQLLNILSLMWGEVYKNREFNDGVPEDSQRECVCVLDEAHKFINTRNPKGLEFIDKLARRGRKYLNALWFASQSPRDFAPSGADEKLDKIKDIFSLMQYKILMQQDSSNYDILEKLFPEFTRSEIESTSRFGKGDKLLSLGSGQKIRCHRYIPKEDFEYFGGGR
jgi:type IV secretory pathway VirB4 component